MPNPDRYELIETIAKGDFATVFRARDRELGREVAIKQIHQQYLEDPAQLERYWQEAQLLASLEHPYIMTIYDVVRERGWLVLELMKGSLQQQLAGNPIDLEDLRLTMIYTLSALQFLHKNGIIHGDVKPGNLLLDRNSRIKLGDFGIARRIAGNDGSVVKGTTKYMAPEVLSDQFGEVGPHSDIYSLGFSAYELMCGSHFESLFPGLHMFGRDPQVAWMMWHSTPDRRLPEIAKVLEGVPADLAAVIERMVEKDPAKRYKNADRPLADLRARGEKPSTAEAEEQAVELKKTAGAARNKRYLVIGALAVSMLLSVAMLFIPGSSGEGGRTRGGGNGSATQPKSGRVVDIRSDFKTPFIQIEVPGAAVPHEEPINLQRDQFFLNDVLKDISALKIGDEVEIRRLTSDKGETIRQFYASRPEAQTAAGKIASLDMGQGVIRVTVAGRAEPLEVYVPNDAVVQLNKQNTLAGRRLDLRDLLLDDQVDIEYRPDGARLKVIAIAAQRNVKAQGFVKAIDPMQGLLTIRLGEAADAAAKSLPLAEACVITINGAAEKDGQPVSLAQLQEGDRITIEHDWQVRRIDALRGLEARGVVLSVDHAAKTFAVGAATFSLAPECRILAVGIEAPVSLAFLRPGDTVVVSHNSFDLKSPVAEGLSIEPAADKLRWALLLAAPKYAPDARRVQTALAQYYRVAAEQSLLIESGDAAALKSRAQEFLGRVALDSQLVVYAAGDGKLEMGAAYVMDGLELDWLLDQLEAAPAAERLLLLDTCHADGQPSAAELAEARNSPGVPVSESVAVLAGCKAEEKGLPHASGLGLLAHFTALAFEGAADLEPRDGRVNATELAAYLDRSLASSAPAEGPRQTPQLFAPGKIPRIHPQVKEAVLAMLLANKLDDGYHITYETAQRRAAGQPDLEIAHALVLLEVGKDTKTARDKLAAVRNEFPEAVAALPGSAWLKFVLGESITAKPEDRTRLYVSAIDELAALVRALPESTEANPPPPYAVSLMRFSGALRQFAVKAADPYLSYEQVKPLDDFFLGRDDAYAQAYRRGIDLVDTRLMELNAEILAAAEPAGKDLLLKRRKRIITYLPFDYRSAADLVRAQLDQ
jgi:serine/threonine-protein kinase